MTSLRGHERNEFPQAVRKEAFRRACLGCCVEGVDNVPGVPQCETCGKVIRAGNLVFEHDRADGLGGQPTAKNCKVHCGSCATKKTTEEDNPVMAKADRVLKATYGLKARRGPPMPGSRASGIRKRMNGDVERWT